VNHPTQSRILNSSRDFLRLATNGRIGGRDIEDNFNQSAEGFWVFYTGNYIKYLTEVSPRKKHRKEKYKAYILAIFTEYPMESETAPRERKIRRGIVMLSSSQVALGAMIIGMSFTAFASTSSAKIRGSSPYWAGFMVRFSVSMVPLFPAVFSTSQPGQEFFVNTSINEQYCLLRNCIS
jgi:hypothetical protein